MVNKHNPDDLRAFCDRWKIAEVALFGSVIRPAEFGPDSDIDILISFQPGAERTLFDYVDMQDELRNIFQREVDLVSKEGIERSKNQLRRDEILNSARVIYVHQG